MWIVSWLYEKRQKQSPEVSEKKGVLKKFCKFHRKSPVLQSHFNKVAGLQTYFEKHLQTTASEKMFHVRKFILTVQHSPFS